MNISFYTYAIDRLYVPIYTLENYVTFFSDPFYLRITAFTIEFSGAVTILALAIGYPIAYKLARVESKSLRTLMIALVLSPTLISSVVQIYGWSAILASNGLVNNILVGLHIVGTPLPLLFNVTGVMIGLVQYSLPIMVLSNYGVIGGIDRSLEDAARVLGSGRATTFLRVTLPLSYPGIIAGSILVFASVFPSFVYPTLLGGGRVSTLGSITVTRFVSLINWPLGTAMGFVLLLVALIILFVFTRSTSRYSGAAAAA